MNSPIKQCSHIPKNTHIWVNASKDFNIDHRKICSATKLGPILTYLIVYCPFTACYCWRVALGCIQVCLQRQYYTITVPGKGITHGLNWKNRHHSKYKERCGP